MKKRFGMNYNADAGESSGGSTEVSAVSTAPAQSDAGSQAPQGAESAPVHDKAFFDDINRRMVEEGYEPPDEIVDAYSAWKKTGDKVDPKANPEQKDSQPSKDATAEKPKGNIDVEKLVREGKSNSWSAEESAAVEAAMAKIGAKSPREILEKVEGLQTMAGKKGQELGDLQRQLQETVQSQEALFNDLKAGRPEALRYLQEEFGLTLAQAKAASGNAQAGASSVEDSIPEDVIDTAAYKLFKKETEALRNELKSLQEARNQEAQKIQEERKQAERHQAVQQARSEYVDQLVSIAESDSEMYGVKSASLRDLLTEYFKTGKVDPRIQNHLELAKFAVENKIPDLRNAHKLKNFDRMNEIALQKVRSLQGTNPADLGAPNTLSGMRGKNGANNGNPQITVEDVMKMNAGTMEPPREWYQGTILMRDRVPEHLRQHVFGKA